MAALLTVCLLFAGSAAATPAASPSAGGPVARAVLFYAPSCEHCHEVISGYLPYLMEQYGNRLQILSVDASVSPGLELFKAAVTKYHVPRKDRGVPAIVIGDHFLSGPADISAQMPTLIGQYLVEGGVEWPAVPGLAQVMTAEGGPATTSPSQLLGTSELRDGVLDRVARDRWGNTAALVVLVGMLAVVGTVIWRAGRIWRALAAVPRSGGWRAYVVIALTGLGLCVSVYLAYVETTHSAALCGPVGNCNAVQQSTYAQLFGVLPVAYAGMVGYLLIGAAFCISRLGSGSTATAAARAFFLLTLCGTLFSIYLTALEPFVIGASCAWCLTSAVITTSLLLLSVSGLRRFPHTSTAAGPSFDVADAPPPRG